MSLPATPLTAAERREMLDLTWRVVNEVYDESNSTRLESLVLNRHDGPAAYLRSVELVVGLQWRFAATGAAVNLLARPTGIPQAPAPDKAFAQLLTDLPARSRKVAKPRLSIGARVRTWQLTPRVVRFAASIMLVGYFVGVAALLVQNSIRKNDPDSETVETSGPVVARLVKETNCNWKADDTAKSNGPNLKSGRVQLLSGTAELSLVNGVHLVIEGPSQLDLREPSNIGLDRGRITATVPSSAVGFTVKTPQAKIVDLGTKFGVNVSETGATEVEVLQGHVEFLASAAPAADRATPNHVRLSAGQAARIDSSQSRTIQPLAAKSKPIAVSKNPSLNALRSPYQELVLQTEPKLYWDFETQRDCPVAMDIVRSHLADGFVSIEVGVPGPRGIDGYTAFGSTNSALRVRGAGAIVCQDLARVFGVRANSYSVQLWFNSAVDLAGQQAHYLLGRGNGSGLEDLRDCVFIAVNSGDEQRRGRLGFFSGKEPEVAFGNRTLLVPNHWYHLVFVRNGEAIRVYLDGEFEFASKMPWLGGDGEHFSAGHRTDLCASIGLNGSFDEVAVWNRALGEQEIARIYARARAMNVEDGSN